MRDRNLFEKLWQRHVVSEPALGEHGPTLLYIDRHLVSEVTSPQAFEGLRIAHRTPRRPETAIATADHNVPTTARVASIAGIADPAARAQVEQLGKNCAEFGITQFALEDRRQGIIHVIGPECVFRAKLDTHSTANWTLIPRQSGRRFQRKLDTDSASNWTV